MCENREDIGQLIKRARKAKKVSAQSLGERLDPPVTHGAVYGWESGKSKPNADVIWQISEILEVDIRTFYPEPSSDRSIVVLDDPVKTDIREIETCYVKMTKSQRSAVLSVARAMVE